MENLYWEIHVQAFGYVFTEEVMGMQLCQVIVLTNPLLTVIFGGHRHRFH